jgi:hypothetical protein
VVVAAAVVVVMVIVVEVCATAHVWRGGRAQDWERGAVLAVVGGGVSGGGGGGYIVVTGRVRVVGKVWDKVVWYGLGTSWSGCM